MGIFAKLCPLCDCGPAPSRRDVDELVNQYVNKESYAGKWITVDVPVDILIYESVDAKDFLYQCCKIWNDKKRRVQFNLDSLRR